MRDWVFLFPRSEAEVRGYKDQGCRLSGLGTEIGQGSMLCLPWGRILGSPNSPCLHLQPIMSLASWTLLELA